MYLLENEVICPHQFWDVMPSDYYVALKGRWRIKFPPHGLMNIPNDSDYLITQLTATSRTTRAIGICGRPDA